MGPALTVSTSRGVLLYAVDRPTVPLTRMRILGHDVHVFELDLNQPWHARDAAALFTNAGATGA